MEANRRTSAQGRLVGGTLFFFTFSMNSTVSSIRQPYFVTTVPKSQTDIDSDGNCDHNIAINTTFNFNVLVFNPSLAQSLPLQQTC